MSRATTTRRPFGALCLGIALPLLALVGCAAPTTDAAPAGTASSAPDAQPSAPPEPQEVAAASPRLVLTHDGGIQVLDATTLEVVGEVELAGFNRLNGAGDGRHVLISTAGEFRALDTGTWARAHGDHAHYYTAEPVLTSVAFDAEMPGHVVTHGGRTALFDDGTGEVTVFDSDAVVDGEREERRLSTPEVHHGVALELGDGSLVLTEGDEERRTGIRVLDGEGQEIAASDECPGVHGEAVAAGEAVVVGCEDGVLVYRDGAVTKVDSPDPYGRIGNQAGSESSPIVLGDYKSDPDAELERPTRVSLIDTRTDDLRLVQLPASYTFRSLGRGEDGEALVLGTDGALHVIDAETGDLVRSVPVIEPWEEPVEWQEPRPTLHVLDGTAYVTDPATDTLHAVDVHTGEIWNTTELTVTPNELTGVSGDVPALAGDPDDEHAHEDHAHEDHAHEDHAHDDHGHADHTDGR
ncbi:zinc metallochaperone AztD [Georgenia sp. SUBG003]|uniref:zinc metallochaperone AztD n=1 Tax=Georgenia sp. SUBG003 TaxID=1497974 RepID=UPI0005B928BE